MKIKKGDKVKVISLEHSFYKMLKASDKVKSYLGETMTVKRVYPNGTVTLENCSYVFNEKDLELEKEGEYKA